MKWSLRGQRGVAYLIEVSADLSEWTPFSTITLTSDVATFKELAGQAQKYYRARVLN